MVCRLSTFTAQEITSSLASNTYFPIQQNKTNSKEIKPNKLQLLQGLSIRQKDDTQSLHKVECLFDWLVPVKVQYLDPHHLGCLLARRQRHHHLMLKSPKYVCRESLSKKPRNKQIYTGNKDYVTTVLLCAGGKRL